MAEKGKKPAAKRNAPASTAPLAGAPVKSASVRTIKKFPLEEFAKALKDIEQTLAAAPDSSLVELMARSGLSNPLIFAGAQQVRIKRTVAWIKERFFPSQHASVASYFGSDLGTAASVAPIVQSLGMLSLFCKASLVVVFEADKIKAAAAKALLAALAKPSPFVLCIFVAEAASQKSGLLPELEKTCTLVEFKELEGAALRRWIEREISANDVAGITKDALDELVKRYGSDLDSLSRTINHLSLLVPQGRQVTKTLVDDICSKNPETHSFEVVRRLAAKNPVGAVLLTQILLAQGFHELQLSSFLSRCFRTLLAQRGSSMNQELAPELSNPWFVKNLAASSRTFSTKDLVSSLEVLKLLDFQLKDSRLPDSLVISTAMQRIATRQFNLSEH